jgi:hypothetical protein
MKRIFYRSIGRSEKKNGRKGKRKESRDRDEN